MPRYLIREQDVPGYSPANHHGTVNRRLVSAANVGARHMELVLGTLEQGGGGRRELSPCETLEETVELARERGASGVLTLENGVERLVRL